MTTTYVALLRGINVGGHAKVAMADLRRSFVDLGHADVRTYIQSGNVLFTSPAGEPPPDAAELEGHLARDLGAAVTVVLRTAGDLAELADRNPFLGGGIDLSTLYVTFLAEEPDRERAARLAAPGGTTDELALVGREVYVRCPSGYGRTKLHNTFVERRLGVAATTRGWNTVIKLRRMAGE